ncbi:MAG: hypothetical protein J6X28_00925 [Bacilli bacterium]|nr:hypothetical protein [Bacilli bacterium]
MKNLIENIRNFRESKENQTQKTILFFAFYVVFFLILFGVISLGGDRQFLFQEYEKGNNSISTQGVLNKNYVYDYQIKLDGEVFDYYGKRYQDVESFKYNNQNYYREKGQFFVQEDLWVKCENPYRFYEFLDYDQLSTIIAKSTFIAKTEYENGNVVQHYLITSNDLSHLWSDEETDYGDDTDTIDVQVNSENQITKITYGLDHYCVHKGICTSSLLIEMNFEMFGDVEKIDNPTE